VEIEIPIDAFPFPQLVELQVSKRIGFFRLSSILSLVAKRYWKWQQSITPISFCVGNNPELL
jgi:hypothetical protein